MGTVPWCQASTKASTAVVPQVKLTDTFLKQITANNVTDNTKQAVLHHLFKLASGWRPSSKRHQQQQATMKQLLLSSYGCWCSKLVRVEPVGMATGAMLMWHVDVDRHSLTQVRAQTWNHYAVIAR